MKFRRDVNGLRALAVLAVVIYHFYPNILPGGFAGVDVFFVISGFLMTGIILNGLDRDNFSLINFYMARANRIVPALAVLCLVLLSIGWFLLPSIDYKALSKHAGSSIAFISNIVYWAESGYFDSSSREKWLLHTWSLSVEWQFYILYPMLLICILKFVSQSSVKYLLLLGTLSGLLFSIYASSKWPNSSYYMLSTRAWELMFGGLAFVFPINYSQKVRVVISYIGLFLIAVSYIWISKVNVWPGYMALLPVVGTFIVIQAKSDYCKAVNNPIMQYIGSWSYSIYLWHWPIVVGMYILAINVGYYWIGVGLSFFLGYLSYRFVEQALAKDKIRQFKDYFKAKPIVLIFAVGGLSSFVFLSGGGNYNQDLSNKYPKLNYPIYCHIDYLNADLVEEKLDCKLGNQIMKPVGLLIGDSYAGMFDPFFSNIIGENLSFMSRSTSHCVPSLKLNDMLGPLPNVCKKIRQKSHEEISLNKYQVVVLAGRWDYLYANYGSEGVKSLVEMVDFASKHAKFVYIIEQPIYYRGEVHKQFLRNQTSKIFPEKFVRDDTPVQFINKKIRNSITQKNLINVHFITRDMLYGSVNHGDLTDAGIPYTFDQGHLTEAGSLAASNNFMRTEEYNILLKAIEN